MDDSFHFFNAQDDDDARSNGNCVWCRRTCGRLFCAPLAFALTALTITAAVTFCVVPAVLVLGFAASLYYCCTRDPVPVRLLLAALLLDGGDGTSNPALAQQLSKSEIQAALIRRTCLEIRGKQDKALLDDNNCYANHFTIETK